MKIRNAAPTDFDTIVALNEASVSLLSPLSPPRYPRFLYVDRVVVSGAARRCGAGTLLYRQVFEFAGASAVELVTCEFDVDPPNPASRHFHAAFGFREAGRQWIGDGQKQVSLHVAAVRPRTR